MTPLDKGYPAVNHSSACSTRTSSVWKPEIAHRTLGQAVMLGDTLSRLAAPSVARRLP
jgi:hypothetical protein